MLDVVDAQPVRELPAGVAEILQLLLQDEKTEAIHLRLRYACKLSTTKYCLASCVLFYLGRFKCVTLCTFVFHGWGVVYWG